MPVNHYSVDLSRFSTHRRVLEILGDGNRVLDVGCNEGYLGESDKGGNVFYGLDYSDAAVSAAKGVYADAAVYDLNLRDSLPWDLKFDVLVFADVLEHVLDPLGALQHLVAIALTPGGRVIVSLPNVANWQIRALLAAGRFDYTDVGILDRTHLHMYTFRSGRKLLEDAGLMVTRQVAGASILGGIISLLPATAPLLATSMIFDARA